MQRVAIMIHKDGKVAPVDDAARHFDDIKLYDVSEKAVEPEVFPGNPAGAEFDLLGALKLARVTDVIGQHFEDGCYKRLHKAGIRLWLEAPGFDERESLDAFKRGYLTEAALGAHAVHGPEGRRVRQHHASRAPRHTAPDRAVSPPVQGGKMPPF